MNNPIKGVLYLEREHFELSLETRADMLQYIYPPEFVSNLDIINADGLKLNLSEFIKKNNVIFTDLIIVLSSSIIFEREFKTGQESATQEYMDNVPFETISIIRIPTQLGTKVLVANATFYTLLADVFLQFGVKVDFVVPELALGGPVGTFSVSTARYILTRNEALAPYKFVIDSSTVTTLQPTETKQEKVAKKKCISFVLTACFWYFNFNFVVCAFSASLI